MPTGSTPAKLTPPRFPKVVERTRLFRWLDQARKDRPIIWIKGPPGSGKTTLGASYLRIRKIPILWYQLDEGDADPATLFHYLQLASKKAAPRYRQSLPHLTPEYLAGIHVFARRFFEQLYARLKSPGVVVFDNYQDIPREASVHELVRIGLEVIPNDISVICISREDPPPAFARLHAGQTIAQLGEESLRLTRDEAKDLIQLHAKSAKRFLSKDILDELFAKTQGWTAGLVLLLEQTKGTQDTEVVSFQQPPGVLFDYLANEVLKRLPPESQDFLLKTSFLPTMTAPMAAQLTRHDDAEGMLNWLYRTRYFTERRPEPVAVFQYHPLFREFLQNRARQILDRANLKSLQIIAGTILEQKKHLEEAVGLFQQAGEEKELSRLILTHAENFIAQGRFQMLGKWIASLSKETLAKNPWLQYWQATTTLPFGPKLATPLFIQAFEQFQAGKDQTGSFLTCCGILKSILMTWDDLSQLDPWIETLKKLTIKDAPFPSLTIEAEVTGSLFDIMLWRHGLEAEKSYWADRTLALLPHVRNPIQRAHFSYYVFVFHLWNGNFLKAEEGLALLRGWGEKRDASPITKMLWCLSEAQYARHMADYERSLRFGSKGMDIVKKEGLSFWAMQFAIEGGIPGALGMGDTPKAKWFLDEANAAGKPKVFQSMYHYIASYFYLSINDWEKAKDHVKAVEPNPQTWGPFPEGFFRLIAAQVLFEVHERQKAENQLRLVLPIIKQTGSKVFEFVYWLCQAYFSLEQNKFDKAITTLRRAIKLGKEHGLKTNPWWRPEMMAKLCAKALEFEIETDFVRGLIRRHKLPPWDPDLTPANWPWPIKVFTSGRFAIEVDGQPLYFTKKAPKRPLQLLKALIASGRSEVTEIQIADELWSESEGDAAHKTLVKTVERLRKVLGPRALIHLQDGRIILDPHVFWIDVRAFEALLAQGDEQVDIDGRKDRPSHSDRALALYHGLFLPDDVAEPWTALLRERLKQKYLRTLVTLCQSWCRDGKGAQAVQWLEQAVDREPLEEVLYQQLMIGLHALGRHSDVSQVYERCRKTLEVAIDQNPSDQTHQIYESCREPLSIMEKEG